MNHFKTVILIAMMTVLFMGVGFLIGGPRGMMLALIVAGATNLLAWWNSDKMALRMHKAREVTAREAPDLHEMVAKLAARADLPMPRVYLIDSPQPNAFATGRDPENAAVAATTGILQLLNRDEFEGVMAHELAHIKNRDTLTMTMAATIAGAISMMSQYGLWFGGGSSRNRPLGGFGLLLAAILAPMGALVIQMFISRSREYEADRMGAMISGNPLALASALQKISAVAKRRMMPSAERNPASAHLFIINPLTGGKIDSMFSTHPNVENRVRELIELAKEMGQDVADALTGGGPGDREPQRIPVRTSSVPRTRRDSRRGPWR